VNSGIAKRILHGFSANLYGQVVIVVIQLAGVPVLLHSWGTQMYGEWLMLSAIPVYLSMTDLGFSQSAANDMSQQMGRGDRTGALAVFQSIGLLIALCSVVGMLVVITLVMVIPFFSWIPLHLIDQNAATWVLVILAAEVFIKLNDGTLHAGYRANGGYATHIVIYFTTILIQNIALWSVAVTGGGPVRASAAFLFVRVMSTPVVAILMIRRYPWLSVGISHSRFSEIRRLFKPALANIAFPLGQALNIQGMTLVVAAALGPIAVVVFSTLRTLSRLVIQAVRTITHATEPEMATAYGVADTFLLRRLYIHATQIAVVFALISALLLYWLGDWILTFWTHGKVAINFPLFAWLLASAVAGSFWYSALIILKAANHHIHAAVFFVAAALISLFVAYTTMKATNQMSGVGLVLLVVDIIMIIYVQIAANRLCGGGLFRQLINPKYLCQ